MRRKITQMSFEIVSSSSQESTSTEPIFLDMLSSFMDMQIL